MHGFWINTIATSIKTFQLKGSLCRFITNFWRFIKRYTVSWRIRIFNCIEEVLRFFFLIEFNSAFQISNYLQLNSTPYTLHNLISTVGPNRAWVQILDGTLPWWSLWTELCCNKEFFKQASTPVENTLWMLHIINVWMKEKKIQQKWRR
jgi:hypothetical protein